MCSRSPVPQSRQRPPCCMSSPTQLSEVRSQVIKNCSKCLKWSRTFRLTFRGVKSEDNWRKSNLFKRKWQETPTAVEESEFEVTSILSNTGAQMAAASKKCDAEYQLRFDMHSG